MSHIQVTCDTVALIEANTGEKGRGLQIIVGGVSEEEAVKIGMMLHDTLLATIKQIYADRGVGEPAFIYDTSGEEGVQ